tara:strand:- start:373 stop:531 length:159 start_codon:yes stop_codon:yes gene_type:complete
MEEVVVVYETNTYVKNLRMANNEKIHIENKPFGHEGCFYYLEIWHVETEERG